MKELTIARSSEEREDREWQKDPLEGIFFLNKMCLPLSASIFAAIPRTESGLPRNPHGGIAAATPAT